MDLHPIPAAGVNPPLHRSGLKAHRTATYRKRKKANGALAWRRETRRH
jgi:hypothetical protein